MTLLTKKISGFNHWPIVNCQIARPQHFRDLSNFVAQPCIARGNGLSYGDASLYENGIIIDLTRLNRFLDFDNVTGRLTVESGITLEEISATVIPQGWCLAVVPGTQYATVGGCVASDVHGKNHLKQSSFGQHVLEFKLLTANGNILTCSPQENSELFKASIGGLGLTGIFTEITLQLMPIETSFLNVQSHITHNLASFLSRLQETAEENDYSVGWLDLLNSKNNELSGVISTAHHVKITEMPKENNMPLNSISQTTPWTIPFTLPWSLLRRWNMRWYNRWYLRTHQKHHAPHLQSMQQYFYPLDHFRDWNKLYGKKGFFQYQCCFPLPHAEIGIQQLINLLNKSNYSSMLTTIKYFGSHETGLLSFPIKGYTIAFDIPNQDDKVLKLLDQFDEVVLQHQGRVYLAKDARLSSEHFRSMYPQYSKWLSIKRNIDPNNQFISRLAKRLRIGED